jgi:hypothetical protein
VGNNKNPNQKQPGEKNLVNSTTIPGNMSGKTKTSRSPNPPRIAAGDILFVKTNKK